MEAERNWGAEPGRRPTIGALDRLVVSEHGRIVGRTDYRSHWLCIVKQEYGGYVLLVKHGGGEERIGLGFAYRMDPVLRGMEAMDSDTRYLTMYALYEMHRDAVSATDAKWRAAIAENRVERRRVRGGTRERALYHVTIKPQQERTRP